MGFPASPSLSLAALEQLPTASSRFRKNLLSQSQPTLPRLELTSPGKPEPKGGLQCDPGSGPLERLSTRGRRHP